MKLIPGPGKLKTFVVRIYRQETGADVRLHGIVEDATTGISTDFHNKEELWGFMEKEPRQMEDRSHDRLSGKL